MPEGEKEIQRIKSAGANGVNRLNTGNTKLIKDGKDTSAVASHKLGWAEGNGKIIIFPSVQQTTNGSLHDYTNPIYKHDKGDALDNAIANKDTVQVSSPEFAEWFTNNNYKKYGDSTKKYTK